MRADLCQRNVSLRHEAYVYPEPLKRVLTNSSRLEAGGPVFEKPWWVAPHFSASDFESGRLI